MNDILNRQVENKFSIDCKKIKQVVLHLFRSNSNEKCDISSLNSLRTCIKNLVVIFAICWLSLEFMQKYVQNASRRMCNLPFIFLTVNIINR